MSPAEISENDIVFECPSCAQSMAIDVRGAGMVIPCKGCGREVQVPASDELLSSGEELEASDYKINRLTESLKELQVQQDELTALKQQNDGKLDQLRQEIQKLQAKLHQDQK